ncbi:MAG TPA: YfhO family protein [Tepidisphaeraceae bacterium]|nr:YfhO family protein [Tepidisphaeraceae bacterium]
MAESMVEVHPPAPAAPPDANPAGHRERLAGPAVLLLLTLAIFAPVLVRPNGQVLSFPGSDIILRDLWWYRFGFGELARGHLVLWNPYVFSGAPFFGGLTSGLLYPANWLQFVLPTHVSLNWLYASHVFLAGLFTYACCRNRGLSRPAGVLAGVMFMFAGPMYLHIFAGHAIVVCGVVWLPLVLLALDRLIDGGSRWWSAAGAAGVALQIYGGSQHFYLGAVVFGLYALLHAVASRPRDWRTRLRPLLAYAAVYALAALLAAAQLFPALEATRESVRAGGVPIAFAASFSLPPENLATLLHPNLYGSVHDYFGRCFYWEACLFAGVTGLLLAACAAIQPDPRRRFAATMVIASIVLALGYHTPLFKVLYHWLPGYNTFRGSAKFSALTVLFLSMLAAVGLDRLGGRDRYRMSRLILLVGAAVALLLAATMVQVGAGEARAGIWASVLRTIASTGESVAPVDFSDPAFIRSTAAAASSGLVVAAVTAGVVAALAWLRGRTRYAAHALIGLCMLELLVFARSNYETIPAYPKLPQPWVKLLEENPGDYRVLLGSEAWANWGVVYGFKNLYGYDSSSVTKRMAHFLAFSQGMPLDRAEQSFDFETTPDLYRMLRCRYRLVPDRNRPFIELKDPLPRALLVPSYVVRTHRDDVLRELGQLSFDPRSTVVLETQPSPTPQPDGASGTVNVESISTEELHFDVNVPAAALLLVTDNYSRLWRATPLAPGPQERYEILPANQTIRAIPLAAGRHRFRMRYEPAWLAPGFWTTGITLAALAAAGTYVHIRPRFRSRLA